MKLEGWERVHIRGFVGVLAVSQGLLAGGCLRPPEIAPPPRSAFALHGQVERSDRTILASMQDIANGATVSLIDAADGNTIQTALTTKEGEFVLDFGNWKPDGETPYYLCSLKSQPLV